MSSLSAPVMLDFQPYDKATIVVVNTINNVLKNLHEYLMQVQNSDSDHLIYMLTRYFFSSSHCFIYMYLGVRTCELFLCFAPFVFLGFILLTSLFYVTGEFNRFLHRG